VDELIFRSFKGSLAPDEARALAAWRAESPKHEARYRELRALAELTAAADEATRVGPPPPIAELVRRAAAGSAARVAPPRRISHKLAIAATIGLAAGALLVAGILTRSNESWSGFTPDQVVTGANETTTVTFPDGTVVRLAPDSRLRVTPGRSRDVTLEGRAFFDVAKVGRRFRVRTPAGDAVVLGTRFEVQATERTAQVLVLEGRVALGDGGERVEVAAGEVSRLVQGTASRPERVPDASARVSWIGRLLVFRGTPVAQALQEIERQYGASIELRDSALGRTTITGWYADKSFEQVMQIVCSVLDRECVIGASRATIDRAQAR
jgi:transmembrane sensor